MYWGGLLEYVRRRARVVYIRACVYVCTYNEVVFTQVRVKKISVEQTGLQGISKKGNNHSSCAFNASTSVYAYSV